jgi:hypothetical protein
VEGGIQFRAIQQHSLGEQPDPDDEDVAFTVSLQVAHDE